MALAQALAVAAVLGTFGRQSFGQLNPALTAGLVVAKRLDPAKAALALLCQLLGAALAGLLLSAAFSAALPPAEPPYLGAVVPSGVGFRTATLLEAVVTLFLALAARRGAEGKRGLDTAWLAGAVAGAGSLAIGPLTGAALNPARAFGPAVASGYWVEHYVYWMGPLAGGVAGTLLAEYFFEK